MVQDVLNALNLVSIPKAGYNLFKFEEGCLKAKVTDWQDQLWLMFIEVKKKDIGKGLATKFMNFLTKTADVHKVKIRLEPKAYKKYGMDTEALKKWYEGFGFKPANLGLRSDYINGKRIVKQAKGMIRKPQVV